MPTKNPAPAPAPVVLATRWDHQLVVNAALVAMSRLVALRKATMTREERADQGGPIIAAQAAIDAAKAAMESAFPFEEPVNIAKFLANDRPSGRGFGGHDD